MEELHGSEKVKRRKILREKIELSSYHLLRSSNISWSGKWIVVCLSGTSKDAYIKVNNAKTHSSQVPMTKQNENVFLAHIEDQ